LYDLVFVEHGPLPPHERTWRHPSELGPTRADIDTGGGGRATALATGTFAVMIVAVMIVAMTPRSSSGPVSLSATTTPAFLSTSRASDRPAELRPVQPVRLASFVAMPHAITSAPQITLDGRDVADELPDAADLVLLWTEAVTYQLTWSDVTVLSIPDGSVVVDMDGDLVAHVSDGRLVTLSGG
jgi:hypothetical protein